MEHAQREKTNLWRTANVTTVLILILMEHAQRERKRTEKRNSHACLNPYFNGTCSKRQVMPLRKGMCYAVLILILMEHAQREAFAEGKVIECRTS